MTNTTTSVDLISTADINKYVLLQFVIETLALMFYIACSFLTIWSSNTNLFKHYRKYYTIPAVFTIYIILVFEKVLVVFLGLNNLTRIPLILAYFMSNVVDNAINFTFLHVLTSIRKMKLENKSFYLKLNILWVVIFLLLYVTSGVMMAIYEMLYDLINYIYCLELFSNLVIKLYCTYLGYSNGSGKTSLVFYKYTKSIICSLIVFSTTVYFCQFDLKDPNRQIIYMISSFFSWTLEMNNIEINTQSVREIEQIGSLYQETPPGKMTK